MQISTRSLSDDIRSILATIDKFKKCSKDKRDLLINQQSFDKLHKYMYGYDSTRNTIDVDGVTITVIDKCT